MYKINDREQLAIEQERRVRYLINLGYTLVGYKYDQHNPQPNKKPLTLGGTVRYFSDPDIAAKQLTPVRNVGIVLPADHFIVDADDAEAVIAVERLMADLKMHTPMVSETYRGRHYFFRLPCAINGKDQPRLTSGASSAMNVDLKVGTNSDGSAGKTAVPLFGRYRNDDGVLLIRDCVSAFQIESQNEIPKVTLRQLEGLKTALDLQSKPVLRVVRTQTSQSQMSYQELAELLDGIDWTSVDYHAWLTIVWGVANEFGTANEQAAEIVAQYCLQANHKHSDTHALNETRTTYRKSDGQISIGSVFHLSRYRRLSRARMLTSLFRSNP